MTSVKTFILIACATMGIVSAGAQQKIQNDPEIKVGKLENGMTYYLRENSNPKGCADFYIAHNVGALQEEDNQNGLAHFLEHMAFNGTKHYPDKSLLEFLSKDGVRFGYNVNAYTSRFETVYNLSDIPLERESFVDSVMLILHDWSCNISCEQEDLDAERGVISEEWRRRDEVRSRMAMAQTNLIYNGAKHTERSVLGTLEIINGFKRQEILDFYEKWYRPDLQAIIIVGDFDIDDMEARVKRIFSTVPVGENIVPKEEYPVPAIEEPLFENIVDPDIKFQALKVIHRLPFPNKEERQNEGFWKQYFTKNVINSMIATRLKEVAQKPDSPVNSAVVVTNTVSDDFYTTLFTFTPKGEDKLEDALALYTREIKRMTDFGFSKDEFEVAKANIRKRNRLDNEISRESIENEQIVNICLENFLRDFPMVLPDAMLEIQKNSLGNLSYEEVMAYVPFMLRDCEKIYTYNIGTDKAGLLPTTERMKEIIAETEKEVLKPEFVKFAKVDLVKDVEGGKIEKTKKIKGMDGEIWTLGNGAQVYWMPVDKVKSGTHLIVDAVYEGGYNAWDQTQIAKGKAAVSYIGRELGFGKSTGTDVNNSPECGSVRASVRFEKSTSEINISCGKDQAETAFAMLYNYVTRPNFNSEKTLDKFRKNNLKSLGREMSSAIKFSREKTASKYGSHPWIEYVDSTSLETLDMDFLKDIYNRCFGNPADMKLFICTDLDKEEILPLIEKYVASLEKTSDSEKAKVEQMLPTYKGEVKLDKTYPLLSAPKVDVDYKFLVKAKDDAKNNAAFEILDYIMSQRCVAQIREARGGTYHVRFYTESYYNKGMRESSITFQTRPEMTGILIQDGQDLIDNLCSEGPTKEEMDNAVKYLVKAQAEREQRFAENLSRKSSVRRNFILHGVPFDYDYSKTVHGISAKDIQKLAKKVNNGNRLVAIYREQ